MKISYKGHLKNRGTHVLVDEDIKAHYRKSRGTLHWEKNKLTICLQRVRSTWLYRDYTIEISAAEFSLLLDAAICGSTNNVAARAIGKAVGAFFKEIATSSPEIAG